MKIIIDEIALKSQPKSTIFLFLHENMCCGSCLEVPSCFNGEIKILSGYPSY